MHTSIGDLIKFILVLGCFFFNHATGAYLSVQCVSSCSDDSRLWVDGKQVTPRQKRVPDLYVLGSTFISVCRIYHSNNFTCGKKESMEFATTLRNRSHSAGRMICNSPISLFSDTMNCSGSLNVGALSFTSSITTFMSKGWSVSDPVTLLTTVVII